MEYRFTFFRLVTEYNLQKIVPLAKACNSAHFICKRTNAHHFSLMSNAYVFRNLWFCVLAFNLYTNHLFDDDFLTPLDKDSGTAWWISWAVNKNLTDIQLAATKNSYLDLNHLI